MICCEMEGRFEQRKQEGEDSEVFNLTNKDGVSIDRSEESPKKNRLGGRVGVRF